MSVPRLVRPMYGDKIDGAAIEATPDPGTRKKFCYDGPLDGARKVMRLINTYRKPGHVWLRKDGRIKVAGDGYVPTSNEQLVGVYSPGASARSLAEDIELAAWEPLVLPS